MSKTALLSSVSKRIRFLDSPAPRLSSYPLASKAFPFRCSKHWRSACRSSPIGRRRGLRVLGDETGLLVESDSIDALAAALRRHLESPAFLRARAAAGVAIAERQMPPAPVPHTCPSSAVSCASPPGRVGSSERAARESALVVAADRDVTNRIRDPRRARGGVVAILDGARRYAARRKARHPARGCGQADRSMGGIGSRATTAEVTLRQPREFPTPVSCAERTSSSGTAPSSCAIAKVGQCASGTVSTSTRTFAS